MLLAFVVVLFGGLAFMFFCILRNQETMLGTLRQEHAEARALLVNMEKRLATLQQIEAAIAVNPQVRQACVRPQSCASPAQTYAQPATPAAVSQTPPAPRAFAPDFTIPERQGFLERPFTPPVREPADPFGGLSMDPPSSGCAESERPKGGLPELKL